MRCLLLTVFLCGFLPSFVMAQNSTSVPWNCTGRDKEAQLQPSYGKYQDPAYPSALSLFLTLKDRGISVNCVARSTMDRFLTGQIGAAIFRTDKGSFQALFFPTRQQVQEVRFSERREGDWYRHTVSTPPPSITRTWDSIKPEHLVRHDDVLLMITNESLAKILRDTLEP